VLVRAAAARSLGRAHASERGVRAALERAQRSQAAREVLTEIRQALEQCP
jgi:hypothetical protein